jgi:hypothetical protein
LNNNICHWPLAWLLHLESNYYKSSNIEESERREARERDRIDRERESWERKVVEWIL